jgi:broad specificity phosphatase PhoE
MDGIGESVVYMRRRGGYRSVEDKLQMNERSMPSTWQTQIFKMTPPIGIVVALLFVLNVTVSPVHAQGSTGLSPETINALRRGGHVILFRHAATERIDEPSPMDLANCAIQHRLTDQGRDEARAIGAGLRALSIPIGEVRSSPYCRTIETAQLAAGRFTPEPSLLHPVYVPLPGLPVPPPFEQRIDRVKQQLATPPAAGTNTMMVTHGEVAMASLGFAVAFGEGVVHRPDGRGGTAIVARILPDDWAGASAARPGAGALLPRTGSPEVSAASPGAAAGLLPVLIGLLGGLGVVRLARWRRAA